MVFGPRLNDSAIQGFPMIVRYDEHYIPPPALPPPVQPPTKGWRCTRCGQTGPHYGKHTTGAISAVSTSLDSIKTHLRTHHPQTKLLHGPGNWLWEYFIKETLVQKIYSSRLGYYEVSTAEAADLADSDALQTHEELAAKQPAAPPTVTVTPPSQELLASVTAEYKAAQNAYSANPHPMVSDSNRRLIFQAMRYDHAFN
jgi:hypothetical protein